MKKAEVRPARLGWLTSSLGALPGGLVKKGFHGPGSTGPGGGRTPHAMGGWVGGDLGRGRGGRRDPARLSNLYFSAGAWRETLISLPSVPLLFPNVLRSQFPDRLPGLKNWDSQATNRHQDRLPLYSKKGRFYFVSFWLIVVMYFFFFLIMSHLEQCWPPCIH